MSTNLSEKSEQLFAEMRAANQLMTDFVQEHASEVAGAISQLVPFICEQCNLSGLQHSLNVVNMTFASVALDVIKSRNKIDDDTALCLPVDATEMQFALYNLSRFLKSFESICNLIERNHKTPAFKLSRNCFNKEESI